MIEYPFPHHGLTRNTKERVFEALFRRQQGRCFICQVSQAELEAKVYEHALKWAKNQKRLNRSDLSQEELIAWHYRRNAVHWKLHIDHCHTTGMIRGLLCELCNLRLGEVENVAFKPKPPDMREEDFVSICEMAGRWLSQYTDVVLLYMQKARWLPRKNILFHLQGE